MKKWANLPDNLKNDTTRKYYDILCKKKASLVLKRFFDLLISLVLFVILSPIIVILSIIIKLDSKGPVFYKQERVTQYGRIFKILKFRTMVNNADKIGTLVTLDNDSRITRVGKTIRKFRLDEIPQLLNIIVGDMTLVGTRPEVKKYVDAYTDEMKATLLMPAGVTSLASIEFKDEDEIIKKYRVLGEDIDSIYINRILPDKMKFNLEYLKGFNVLTDLKICIKTFFSVLK